MNIRITNNLYDSLKKMFKYKYIQKEDSEE